MKSWSLNIWAFGILLLTLSFGRPSMASDKNSNVEPLRPRSYEVVGQKPLQMKCAKAADDKSPDRFFVPGCVAKFRDPKTKEESNVYSPNCDFKPGEKVKVVLLGPMQDGLGNVECTNDSPPQSRGYLGKDNIGSYGDYRVVADKEMLGRLSEIIAKEKTKVQKSPDPKSPAEIKTK